MGTRDPRIDAYINKSAEFAQPILTHIRELVHSACPEVEETMKWSFPHFTYHGILCSMAAFKAHCALGFWKAALIEDAVTHKSPEAMGQFGRITSIKELPSKRVMTGYVKQAMKLNEDGVVVPKVAKRSAPKSIAALKVPAQLAAALSKNKKAQATFDGFSRSHRKEYIEWVAEAKGEDTRARRVKQAVEWMAAGKARHWKYE